MSSNIVKYGSYDVEEAEAEARSLESGAFMKLKVGRTIVRFLPPPLGRKSPFVIAHQHWFSHGGKDVKFNCPRHMAKRFCPVCQQVDALFRGGADQRERAFDLKAARRTYSVVIDRGDPETGPQILAFGKKIHEKLTLIRKRANDEAFGTLGGDFSNPTDSGFDIAIDRTGTGKNDTEYDVVTSKNRRTLSDSADQINEWLGAMPDLGNFEVVPSDDEIAEMLGTKSGGGGGDFDSDPSPGGGKQPGPGDTIDGDARTAADDANDFDFTGPPVPDTGFKSDEDIPF